MDSASTLWEVHQPPEGEGEGRDGCGQGRVGSGKGEGLQEGENGRKHDTTYLLREIG